MLCVQKINAIEPELRGLSDDELRKKTGEFKIRLTSSKDTLDSLLPEAFAVVREAARRYINTRHFDTQLVSFSLLVVNSMIPFSIYSSFLLIPGLLFLVFMSACRWKEMKKDQGSTCTHKDLKIQQYATHWHPTLWARLSLFLPMIFLPSLSSSLLIHFSSSLFI